jgi:hypothetical protein
MRSMIDSGYTDRVQPHFVLQVFREDTVFLNHNFTNMNIKNECWESEREQSPGAVFGRGE